MFSDYQATVHQSTSRVERLTAEIERLAELSPLAPLIVALQALRGVRLVTAVVLAAEIGDFQRFAKPSQLTAYLGLVPREHSSGSRRCQGGITKTGNKHVRALLVEAAWNNEGFPRASKAIAARRRHVSNEVQRIAEKAEQRLYRRAQRLMRRGRDARKITVAVARELCGFVWAIAREEKKLAG